MNLSADGVLDRRLALVEYALHLLGGIENRLGQRTLPFYCEYNLSIVLLHLFDQNRLTLAIRHVPAHLLLTPHLSGLGHGAPLAEAIIILGRDGTIVSKRSIAPHNIRRRQLGRNRKDRTRRAPAAAADAERPPQVIVQSLALPLAERARAAMPAQSELLLQKRLRLGAGAWHVGRRGRFEVLAQERHARRSRDIAACTARLFLTIWDSVVGPEGRLVEGEDERGPLRNDFGEAGCALEGSCEGADRVDAAYVAESGKSVRYGGSVGLCCLSN